MSEETINTINDSGIDLGRRFHGSDTEDDTFKAGSSRGIQILLVNDAAEDDELFNACRSLNVPIATVNDLKSGKSDDALCVYVVTSFDGVEKNEPNQRIIGRTALIEVANQPEAADESVFEELRKPLYCHAFYGLVICFTGFRDENVLLKLKKRIQFMGGKVRSDVNSEMTHLVANKGKGDKYLYAATFNLPIVTESWINDAWENRNSVNFCAAASNFVSKYRFPVFCKCKICFLGYSTIDEEHLKEKLCENGGEYSAELDDSCTHVVTDDFSTVFPSSNSCLITGSSISLFPSNPDTSSGAKIPRKRLKFDSSDKENVNPDDQTMTGNNRPRKRVRRSNALRNSSNILVDKRGVLKYRQLHSLGDSDPKFVSRRVLEFGGVDSKEIVRADDSMENLWGYANVIDNSREITNVKAENWCRTESEVDDENRFSSPIHCCEPFPVCAPLSDYERRCTFDSTVVADKKVCSEPARSNKTCYVTSDWFWASIFNEYRQKESEFELMSRNHLPNNLTPSSLSNNSLYASSSGRNRKRKRLKDKYLNNADTSPQSAQKRRSSASNLTRLSEGSFLDYTSSSTVADESIYSITSDKSRSSKRYHIFLELWQTETNYVGILKTIMTFKAELEAMIDPRSKSEVLNAQEIKIIFGHLPPIYETHSKMLEELNQMAASWNEDSSVGSLILKYSSELVKVYPPFINFLDDTRKELIECDKSKIRFHAFLKLCQSKPECGRQSLQDLLIRPVQRLPSIEILLKDILKNTPEISPDHNKLKDAIEELKNVNTHINEDKRKTDSQVEMFEIYKKIENCPPDLISSHRCVVNRCEVTEKGRRGSPLVLFLFSDVIEVCKRRTRANKENGDGKLQYKHIEMIRLSSIIKVIDVKESKDAFEIIVKGNQEADESRLLSFKISDPQIEKKTYLVQLCNQILNAMCRTDIDTYYIESECHELRNNTSDGPIGKALNMFTSKTKKINRALSFKQTPSKLKRAVSTMMSPFGIQNGLTPSSQLANLQLAALPPIPNYSDNNSAPETPTSVMHVRKSKSSSFTMGSLRRL